MAAAPAPDAAPSPLMERAGRLLSIRPHSADELRAKLLSAGFADPEVTAAIDRLTELGLLDDSAFASDVTAGRVRRGLRSSNAIASELEAKGVDPEAVAAALAEVDDRATARRLAAAQVARIAGLSLEVQARRIYGALARRGFDEDTIQDALRAVLPPEGWD